MKKADLIVIALTAALATQTGYLLASPTRATEVVAVAIPDSAITQKLETAFAHEAFNSAQLKLKTVNGTVQLIGWVASDEQMNQVEDIASRVAGVKEVRSHLRVKA